MCVCVGGGGGGKLSYGLRSHLCGGRRCGGRGAGTGRLGRRRTTTGRRAPCYQRPLVTAAGSSGTARPSDRDDSDLQR